jgi:CHAT domain-containing protein
VAVVPLAEGSRVDALVSSWRADVSKAPASAVVEDVSRLSGHRLRSIIWDGVARNLDGVRRVYIVPDGSLGLVPFAALPVGREEFLAEGGRVIHYLPAERDILRAPNAVPEGRGLLAVGDPTFGRAARSRTALRTKGDASGCGGLPDMAFGSLTGTRFELGDVAALWRVAHPADVQLILSGDAATESAFKRDAVGRRVLHIATHGVFAKNDCAPAVSGSRGVGGLAATRRSENPLPLSALAMAGANTRKRVAPDEDDGILTAQEVAVMTLSGVQWAVLSACDTGVADVLIFEGVSGLRRAFQIAGVGTVIMSLWSVDDAATRRWMRALYAARLEDGASTAEAMHAANLELLQERRRLGLSTNPFYWAAFVAEGDWR